jgi:hypothetical protein
MFNFNYLFFDWLDSIKYAFNGGAAGILSKFAVYPFDLTKKRLEVVNFEEARSKFGQVFSNASKSQQRNILF